MMRSRLGRIITAILVACAVDACGYHLQGATELPDVMSVTLIDAPDPHTDFVRGLNRSLADNGVQVTQDLDAATAVLIVHHDLFGERILTVSAENEPLEYELFHTVSYELRVDGKAVLPTETLTRRRNYTYSRTDILGKRQEGQILREAIADDLVRTITRRLATVGPARLEPG